MKNLHLCKACGTIARTTKATPGSIFIEIFAWLFMLVPGIIYSLWRISKKHKVCRSCGSPDVIPATSPMAQSIISSNPSLLQHADKVEEQAKESSNPSVTIALVFALIAVVILAFFFVRDLTYGWIGLLTMLSIAGLLLLVGQVVKQAPSFIKLISKGMVKYWEITMSAFIFLSFVCLLGWGIQFLNNEAKALTSNKDKVVLTAEQQQEVLADLERQIAELEAQQR